MKYLAVLLLGTCAMLQAGESLTLPQIEADPKIWPVEVMVTVDHKLPVIIDGKTVRTLKIGPGTMYKVKTISAAGVTVFALGGPKTFAADDTDMIARAEQNKARQAALAAAPPPPPVPSPAAASVPMVSPATVQASSVPAAPPVAPRGLAAKLTGQLVRLKDGRFEPFDTANFANKKYLAVYFSASWCGPCRQFTPALVDWYQQRKAYRDQFDIIFVTADRNEGDMLSYMAGDRMEWPAVSFSKSRLSPLNKYSGNGIPCLVILDENGSVLSNSYVGENYVGPMKPLKDLDRLITGS